MRYAGGLKYEEEKRLFHEACDFDIHTFIGNECFLGTLLTNQSAEALRVQIRARMLDVSESAAALLDGDELERLTAEDEGTEPYQRALETLRAFQDSVDLAYIYGIRDMGDGTFTFTIDPTDDPGEFGEYIEYTEALSAASHGVASVDKVAYTDRWGRFYSAYSPVFDSAGNVGGIVGVDFEASWYEKQIEKHKNTVFLVSLISLLVGAVIVFLFGTGFRKRFLELNIEMSHLTGDMAELSKELRLASGRPWNEKKKKQGRKYDSVNMIEDLNGMVHEVREELRQYIVDAHALAYTDTLTGTGNRTAYFEMVSRMNRLIEGDDADFSVGVFDINGLKKANDEKGHEYGDKLIQDAAGVLGITFQTNNVYRVGGDEFVVVLERASEENLMEMFVVLDQQLTIVNQDRDMPLAISRGVSSYRKNKDKDFNDIFRRADKAMYENKADYYKQRGEESRKKGC